MIHTKYCGNPDCKEMFCNTVMREVQKVLTDEREAMHSHLAGIAYTLKILVGIQQRLLSKFEEAFGTPKAVPYVFSEANAAQNTVYTGPPLAYDGVIRVLVVSGPGNVTVTLNATQLAGGTQTIAFVGCNGGALQIEQHYRMPISSTLSIQTDASAGTGTVGVTAWIEPVVESNPEYFAMRR